MSGATYSAENRIRERIAVLNITAGAHCAIAGIPASRLSEAFRGLRDLSPEDSKTFLDLTDELRKLVDIFAPIPVSLSNAQSVSTLLKYMRDLNISPEEVKTTISKLFKQ